MGKGDRRTRRGKIYNGSFGKSRPKDPKAGKAATPTTVKRVATSAARPAAKTARPAAKKAKAS